MSSVPPCDSVPQLGTRPGTQDNTQVNPQVITQVDGHVTTQYTPINTQQQNDDHVTASHNGGNNLDINTGNINVDVTGEHTTSVGELCDENMSDTTLRSKDTDMASDSVSDLGDIVTQVCNETMSDNDRIVQNTSLSGDPFITSNDDIITHDDNDISSKVSSKASMELHSDNMCQTDDDDDDNDDYDEHILDADLSFDATDIEKILDTCNNIGNSKDEITDELSDNMDVSDIEGIIIGIKDQLVLEPIAFDEKSYGKTSCSEPMETDTCSHQSNQCETHSCLAEGKTSESHSVSVEGNRSEPDKNTFEEEAEFIASLAQTEEFDDNDPLGEVIWDGSFCIDAEIQQPSSSDCIDSSIKSETKATGNKSDLDSHKHVFSDEESKVVQEKKVTFDETSFIGSNDTQDETSGIAAGHNDIECEVQIGSNDDTAVIIPEDEFNLLKELTTNAQYLINDVQEESKASSNDETAMIIPEDELNLLTELTKTPQQLTKENRRQSCDLDLLRQRLDSDPVLIADIIAHRLSHSFSHCSDESLTCSSDGTDNVFEGEHDSEKSNIVEQDTAMLASLMETVNISDLDTKGSDVKEQDKTKLTRSFDQVDNLSDLDIDNRMPCIMEHEKAETMQSVDGINKVVDLEGDNNRSNITTTHDANLSTDETGNLGDLKTDNNRSNITDLDTTRLLIVSSNNKTEQIDYKADVESMMKIDSDVAIEFSGDDKTNDRITSCSSRKSISHVTEDSSDDLCSKQNITGNIPTNTQWILNQNHNNKQTTINNTGVYSCSGDRGKETYNCLLLQEQQQQQQKDVSSSSAAVKENRGVIDYSVDSDQDLCVYVHDSSSIGGYNAEVAGSEVDYIGRGSLHTGDCTDSIKHNTNANNIDRDNEEEQSVCIDNVHNVKHTSNICIVEDNKQEQDEKSNSESNDGILTNTQSTNDNNSINKDASTDIDNIHNTANTYNKQSSCIIDNNTQQQKNNVDSCNNGIFSNSAYNESEKLNVSSDNSDFVTLSIEDNILDTRVGTSTSTTTQQITVKDKKLSDEIQCESDTFDKPSTGVSTAVSLDHKDINKLLHHTDINTSITEDCNINVRATTVELGDNAGVMSGENTTDGQVTESIGSEEEFEVIEYTDKTEISSHGGFEVNTTLKSGFEMDQSADKAVAGTAKGNGTGSSASEEDFEILDLDTEPQRRISTMDQGKINQDQNSQQLYNMKNPDVRSRIHIDKSEADIMDPVTCEELVVEDPDTTEQFVNVNSPIDPDNKSGKISYNDRSTKPRGQIKAEMEQEYSVKAAMEELKNKYSIKAEKSKSVQQKSATKDEHLKMENICDKQTDSNIQADCNTFDADISLAKDLVSLVWSGKSDSSPVSEDNTDDKSKSTKNIETMKITDVKDNSNMDTPVKMDTAESNSLNIKENIDGNITIINPPSMDKDTVKTNDFPDKISSVLPDNNDSSDEEVSEILGVSQGDGSGGDEQESRGRSRHRRTVREVKEAVKRLKSGGAIQKDRPHSYHGDGTQDLGVRSRSGSQRRYDWNTTHFFPDIHDTETVKRRPPSSRYSDFIEESWLKELQNTELPQTEPPPQKSYSIPVLHETMENEGKENQRPLDINIELKMEKSSGFKVNEEGDYACSSDGEPDSPQMWTKSPLHTNKKKRKERPHSQEVNGVHERPLGAIPISRTGLKLGSPGIQRGNVSRRPNAPSMGTKVTPRKYEKLQGSDDIQEKYDKFAELQRRRRALESTSEESLMALQMNSIQDSLRRYNKHKHPRPEKTINAQRKLFQSEQTLVEKAESPQLEKRFSLNLLDEPPPLPKQPPPPIKHTRSVSHGASSSSQDEYANDFLLEMKKKLKSVRKSQEDVRYEEKKDFRNNKRDIIVSREVKDVSEGRRMSPSKTPTSISSITPSSKTLISQYDYLDTKTVSTKQHNNVVFHKTKSLDRNTIPNLEEVFVDDHGYRGSQKMIDRSSSVESRNTPTSQVSEGSTSRKLDARSLVLEERKKFEDYKREYVRRMSSKESTSGDECRDSKSDHLSSPNHTISHTNITRSVHDITIGTYAPTSVPTLHPSSLHNNPVDLSLNAHLPSNNAPTVSHNAPFSSVVQQQPSDTRPYIPPDEYEYILRKIHHTPQQQKPQTEHTPKMQDVIVPKTTNDQRSQGEYSGSYWLESDSYLEKQKQKLYDKQHSSSNTGPTVQNTDVKPTATPKYKDVGRTTDTQKYMDVARQFSFNEDDMETNGLHSTSTSALNSRYTPENYPTPPSRDNNREHTEEYVDFPPPPPPVSDDRFPPPPNTEQLESMNQQVHYNDNKGNDPSHYNWDKQTFEQPQRSDSQTNQQQQYSVVRLPIDPNHFQGQLTNIPRQQQHLSEYDRNMYDRDYPGDSRSMYPHESPKSTQLPDFRSRSDMLKSWSESHITSQDDKVDNNQPYPKKLEQFDHRAERYASHVTDHFPYGYTNEPSYRRDPKGKEYVSSPRERHRRDIQPPRQHPYANVEYSQDKPPYLRPEGIPREPKYWQQNTAYRSVSPQNSPHSSSSYNAPNYGHQYPQQYGGPDRIQRPTYGSLENLQAPREPSDVYDNKFKDSYLRNSLPRQHIFKGPSQQDYNSQGKQPASKHNYPGDHMKSSHSTPQYYSPNNRLPVDSQNLSPYPSSSRHSHDTSFDQHSERSFQIEYKPKKADAKKQDTLPGDRDRYIREYIPDDLDNSRYFQPIPTNQNKQHIPVSQSQQYSLSDQSIPTNQNAQHIPSRQYQQSVPTNQNVQHDPASYHQPSTNYPQYSSASQHPSHVPTSEYPQEQKYDSQANYQGQYSAPNDQYYYGQNNNQAFPQVSNKGMESVPQIPASTNEPYSQYNIHHTSPYAQVPIKSSNAFHQQPIKGMDTYTQQPIRGPDLGNDTFSNQPMKGSEFYNIQQASNADTSIKPITDSYSYQAPRENPVYFQQVYNDSNTYSQVYPATEETQAFEFPQQDQEKFTRQLSAKLKELGESDPRFKEYEDKIKRYMTQHKKSNENEQHIQSQATNQYEAHIRDTQDKYKPQHEKMGQREEEYVDLKTIRQRKEVFEDIRQRQIKRSRSLPRDPGVRRDLSPVTRPTTRGGRQSRKPDSFSPPGDTTYSKEPVSFERKAKTTQSFRYSPERKYTAHDTQTNQSVQKPKKYEVAIEIPTSRYILRPSRSAENLDKLADDLPNVSVQDIKERLFGPNTSSKGAVDRTKYRKKADTSRGESDKQEINKQVFYSQESVKVNSMKDVFNKPIQSLPSYGSVYNKSVGSVDNKDRDQLLYSYASYRDTPSKKKLNIFDDLTDLEVTYERLNLNNDEQTIGGLSGDVPHLLESDSLEPNVKRLSISNVRKFEEMLEQRIGEPGVDRTKQWVSGKKPANKESSGHSRERTSPPGYNSKSQDGSTLQRDDSSSVVASEGPRSYARSSLPRKKADDMAYRKTHQMSLASASMPTFLSTGRYLGNSPKVTPTPSVDNEHRSQSPDTITEKLSFRGYQREGSAKAAIAVDDMRGRTTESKRHRLRSLPDRFQENKPVISHVTTCQVTVPLRIRSQSVERPSRKDERTTLQRSNSFGKGDAKPMSNGIASMVKLFTSPQEVTQSAPDLTKVGTIFSNNYNYEGNFVSEDPKYKHAVKPKKSTTPRGVKMRNEMKARLKMKNSGDSGFCPESESDGYSSSDQFHRQPPDGAFCDSDDFDLRKASSSNSPDQGVKLSSSNSPDHMISSHNVNNNNSRSSSKTPPSPSHKTEMRVRLTPPSMRKVTTNVSEQAPEEPITSESSQRTSQAVRPSHMDFNKMKRKQFFQDITMQPANQKEDLFASQKSQLRYIDDVIESSVINSLQSNPGEVVNISPEDSNDSADLPHVSMDTHPVSGDMNRPKIQLNRDMLRRRDSSPDAVSPLDKKTEVTLVKPKPYPFSSPIKQEVKAPLNIGTEPHIHSEIAKHEVKSPLHFSPTHLKAPPCDDIGSQLDRDLQAAKERLTAKLSPRVQNVTHQKSDTRQSTSKSEENLAGHHIMQSHHHGDKSTAAAVVTASHPPRYSWCDSKSSIKQLPTGKESSTETHHREGFTEEKDGYRRQVNREEFRSVKRRIQIQKIPLSGNRKNVAKVEPQIHLAAPSGHDLSDGEMTDATDITLDSMVRANIRPSSPETLANISARETDTSSTTSENSQKEYIVSEGIKRRPKTVTIVGPSSQSKTAFLEARPFNQRHSGSFEVDNQSNQLVLQVTAQPHSHTTTSVVEQSSQSVDIVTSQTDQSETVKQSSQSQYKRETKKEMREERRLSLKERVQLFEEQSSPFLKGPRVYDGNP